MSTLKECSDFQASMPELSMDGAALKNRSPWSDHLAACPACTREWTDLQTTWLVLDEWQAPGPSDFFDVRLQARLREAVAAPPEGLFEKVRSFLLFSTGRQLRPALAGALALVMIVGGGSGLIGLHQHLAVGHSSSDTLNDLKVLDNNAQALQQMDQLLDENAGDDATESPAT